MTRTLTSAWVIGVGLVIGTPTLIFWGWMSDIIGRKAVILGGFLYDALRIGFDAGAAAKGLIPHFSGSDSVLLATGILGATVMPHVIYLHSALTQDRVKPRDEAEKRTLLRFERIDRQSFQGVKANACAK